MKKLTKLTLISLFVLLLMATESMATTINPFPNLGEMGKHSAAIVHVSVTSNFTEDINGITRFRTAVEVIESIKGELREGDLFLLQNHHRIIGDMESIVWGDLELIEGEEYLLFLDGQKADYWQPKMLSYGAFILSRKKTKGFFVPIDLGTETHIYKGTGSITPEVLGVYKAQELKEMLRDVTSDAATWNKKEVLSDYDIAAFELKGVPPSHCSFLSGTPYARWPDFDTSDLPVRHHVSGDPGCATTAAEVVAAIGDLNANYAGVSLNNAGTHTFVPTCSGGDGATDSEFTSWVSTNLGGTRHLVIQFDDPCDEITDLSGCSGTLAVGGLYWFGSTHNADGMDWRNAAYGYVIVNNGTGACQCGGSTDYQIMLEHEMSHSLNIGHIAGSSTANMNPSCCTAISSLDIECLDFIYSPAPLAIELASFRGSQNGNAIQLDWVTSMEVNNQYFTIEKRSTNGTFEAFTRVDSKGDSDEATNYSIVDSNPNDGPNYYRLVHTDLSGKVTISKMIEVNYYGRNSVDIRPNPVKDQVLRIHWKSAKIGNLQISIFDLQGNLVQFHENQVSIGNQEFPLTIENLASGIYYVKSLINGAAQVEKLVVL